MAIAEAPRTGAQNQIGSADRRKRLGQYFSGLRLARLLAALAGGHEASSVVDPMVGSGDMLLGVASLRRPELAEGIELDPLAHGACLDRAGGSGREFNVVLGSAFARPSIEQLSTREWDLVITNPPYVRYQQAASPGLSGDLSVPSAVEVRAELLETIDAMDALDDADKDSFRDLIRGYSGLADLAVPSWLLCAGLARLGGTLAMVVPNTWLSRDYASPIRLLLDRWFDLTCVVEDRDAAWFPDASVRTALVVATRVPRRDISSSSAAQRTDGFVRIELGQEHGNEESLVGELLPTDPDPESALARLVGEWARDQRVSPLGELCPEWIASSVAGLGATASASVSFGVPAVAVAGDSEAALPASLAAGVSTRRLGLQTLQDLNWVVGQGLRTGANAFFYLRHIGLQGETKELLRTSPLFGGEVLEVSSCMALPVVQRQSDLGGLSLIGPTDTEGRVLWLDGWVLPEDLDAASGELMPENLAAYVRSAAEREVGGTPIPRLSAVAPNARPSRPGSTERYWYQLPPLRPRHRPAIFVPRVNNQHIRAIANAGRETLVDANFATLWPAENVAAAPSPEAIALILNSTWSTAVLEEIGTVLGGGGLKVEASHLRRLPLPALESDDWQALDRLGTEFLANPRGAEVIRDATDALVFRAVAATDWRSSREQFADLAERRLAGRSK